MKKLLALLALTFALCVASQAERYNFAVHLGIWTEGTNSGTCQVTFCNDNLVFVNRLGAFTNGAFNYLEGAVGKYTEGKTGLRTFTVQTGTNSVTGTALNGVVRATSKNFVTKATGTLSCDLPAQ